MAGFDEGRIYVAEGIGTRTGDPGNITGRLTRREAQLKFEEFLRVYHAPGQVQQRKYGDALLADKSKVRVDLQDIKNFDGELGRCLAESPTEYLPMLELAAQRQLKLFHNRDEEGQEPDFSFLQVLLHSSRHFGPDSIREITSESISQLVMVPGIVTACSKPKHKATKVTVMCKDCKNTKELVCKPGMGGLHIPRVCDNSAQAMAIGQEACSLDPFVTLPHRSHFVDQQTIKLQERPEDVPTGELPRSMQLLVDRRLVGTVSPGTRVTATGIYRIVSGPGGKTKNDKKTGGIAIQQPYLHVVGMDEEAEGARSLPTFTAEEEAEFKAYAADSNVHQKITQSIAKNIFGHDKIKEAVACLLFGGARKKLPDGTFRRGDINVLLLGDPSTAKSQFLKFASKTAPIAVYTSGKGSSAAGLTASVIKDASGEFFLEGGAMVLADNGVVCIDEFDKMRPEDRVAIHEAMEQQTISIAKAGITTMLRSRCSVLAAANPPSGRYDDLKSCQENIDLQTTILSRFDLIFIVKDERSIEHDKTIARHVLEVHRVAGLNLEPDEQQQRDEAFLKRYLEYCRSRCSPRLDEQASLGLVADYVNMRATAREKQKDSSTVVPITVRQLEALVRIAESLARMQLKATVTTEHITEAMTLFNASTMAAIEAGLGEVTPEMREEIRGIDEQIRRRVAINATVSERRLVDELVRLGLAEINVRRALVGLVQTQDFEQLRGGKMVRRLR